MGLIDQREGVNLVTVLGAVIRENDGSGVQQKDIVSSTALSKGAVSQNIQKLLEHNLVTEENGSYQVVEDRLLELYRTHLEDFLRRRDLPQNLERINDVRSATKERLPDILDGTTSEVIIDILQTVLASAQSDPQVNTLREVFHRTDLIISRLAEAVEDEDLKQDLQMLAVSMDRASDLIQGIDIEYDLKQSFTSKTAENLLEEIHDE